MAVNFDTLLQNLKDKKYAPYYLLHGEEAWYIDKASDYIEENVLSEAERSFNQQVLYGKDIDFDVLRNACMRYPMMCEKQVIILKEAQIIKEKEWEKFQSYLEKPIPSTLLVICYKYKKFDKRSKLYKIMESHGEVFEAAKMDEKKLPEFIVTKLKNAGLKIKTQAAEMMAENLGSNLENIENAINKLILAKQKGETVDEKDIEAHVGISRDYNAWELNAALGKKDMVKVSKLADYIASHPKEMAMPMVTATLYGYFSKIAIAAEGKEALASAGFTDWNQKEYLGVARQYQGKVKNVLELILEYDLRFKGVEDTGTDAGELAKEMIYKIAYM